jgi:hypothetical protein
LNVGVDEKLGNQIPLDLTFTDQDGRQVRLGDYFTSGPVILFGAIIMDICFIQGVLL